MPFAVDVSNYSGAFDAAAAPDLRDAARRAIIGCQDVGIAVRQGQVLGTCFERQLYIQAYFGVAANREPLKAAAVVSYLGLPWSTRLWIAAEDEIEGLHPDYVDAWLWKQVEAATSLGFTSIGIYTRAEWWNRMMVGSLRYQEMGFPLWLADYDLQPVMEAAHPIVGWTHEMKQFDGWFPGHEVWIAGVRVDLNVYK